MDCSSHNSLKVHFPLLIVAPDEQERTDLLCQLFSRNVFNQNKPKRLVYISKYNVDRDLAEVLQEGHWDVDFNGVIDEGFIRSVYSQLEGEHSFIIIDNFAAEISRDPSLVKLVIDDCIHKYNMTPIVLTPSLFHGDESTPVWGKLALRSGYVFLFGDDPCQAQSNSKYIEEFAAELYPDDTAARTELAGAFMELCTFNKSEHCPETYRSYMFVDRTREDNMIKVYQKRHYEHRPRPPQVRQLPDVPDPRRFGLGSDWWYRTCPPEDPNDTGIFFRRRRGIQMPSDLDTDTKWHAVVTNCDTQERVHKLASYIRQLEHLSEAEREDLLGSILSDVSAEHPDLTDEVFYVHNKEIHSHCLM